MFEFGRDLKRFISGNGHCQLDQSLLELMPLDMMIGQARSFDIESGRVSTRNRFDPAVMAAQMWRDYAFRTGDPLAIRKSATAAEYAGRHSTTVLAAALASLEQARTCILGAELFGTDELLDSAEGLIAGARAAASGEVWFENRLMATEAWLSARQSLNRNDLSDLDDVMAAMARIDRWVEICDKAARDRPGSHARIEATQARLARASLLTRVGVDRFDAMLLEAVVRDLTALLQRLDPDLEPLSRARVLTRLVRAMAYKGRVTGHMPTLMAALAQLNPQEDPVDYEHAPLDWFRHKSAICSALQDIGAQGGHPEAFEQAIRIYDKVLEKPLQPGLALRTRLVHERALCRVRAAEASDNPHALEAAQSVFKAELRSLKPQEVPVEWAIVQTQLSRLYITGFERGGSSSVRAKASYALDSATEIFRDYKMAALLIEAEALLSRVRSSGS